MSIDKDPAFYTLLISVIVGLLGLLNAIGAGILSRILKNQETLFGRVNRTDHKLTALEATCIERHRRDK
jgi:hypothetical protein